MKRPRSTTVIMALAVATAAVIGLPAAAMATTTQTGQPALTGPVTRGIAPTAASGLPLPSVCMQPKKATRTGQCREGTGGIVIVSALGGAVLGTGSFDFANWELLNARSRTWDNTVEMEVTHFSGVAVSDDLVFDLGLSCSAGCTVTSQNPAPRLRLLRGVVFQHMFTVESPGSATVDATQVPQLLVVDLTRISIPFRAEANSIIARCDSLRGVFPGPATPGCVNASFTPTFTLTPASGVSDITAHIARAQAHLKNHWGLKGSGPALHRTTDASLNSRNSAVACGHRGKPPKATQNCDEYPFASTEEGAANNPDFSWAWVDAKQNSRAGGLLGAFYAKNRVIDHDAFWVSVS